jgi:hypothetical protein
MADTMRPVGRRWVNTVMTARLLGPYLAFALLKRVVPLPRLARWAWLRPVGPRDRETEAVALRCAVRLRNKLGGERGDCLHGSLALYRVLSRAGANPRLVVGFRRESSAVSGHAWVEIDDACVLESASTMRGFVAAFSFGPEGLRLPSPGAATDRQAI